MNNNSTPAEPEEILDTTAARATVAMVVRDWEKGEERYAPEPDPDALMHNFLEEEVSTKIDELQGRLFEAREVLQMAEGAISDACSTIEDLNHVAQYMLLAQTPDFEAFPERERFDVSDQVTGLKYQIKRHNKNLEELMEHGGPRDLINNLDRINAIEQYNDWKEDDKEGT